MATAAWTHKGEGAKGEKSTRSSDTPRQSSEKLAVGELGIM
jgi:hypothetical protein